MAFDGEEDNGTGELLEKPKEPDGIAIFHGRKDEYKHQCQIT